MPYLETTDGVPIYYEDEGPRTSSAIFLIHAEPFNTRFWQRNIPELSRRFRVVSMDVRGRGESGKTDDGHNIAQYARDFRQMLEALGLEKVVAVGWSLGSSIIWDYLLQFGTERLVGHVNVDQEPYRYVSEEDFTRRMNMLRTRRLRYHREVIQGYLGPESSEDDGVADWMTYQCMLTPTSAHISAMTDSYYADYRPHLANGRLPTQIYWAKYGSMDEAMANLMGEATPDCEFVFFEHSGHLLPWTETHKFNQTLAAFVGKLLPSP